jgi:hypothetical protein
LRGGAFFQVVVLAHGEGVPNGLELARTAGFATLRQVASAGAFEAQTWLGIGVRALLPFRVLAFADRGPVGGSWSTWRMVDVVHHW